MEEMPSWEQKRLMVYPCEEGHFLRIQECIPCAPGRYFVAFGRQTQDCLHCFLGVAHG